MDPRLERPRWERLWAAASCFGVAVLPIWAFLDFCRQGYADAVNDPFVFFLAVLAGVATPFHCFRELAKTGLFLDGVMLVILRLVVWGLICGTVSAGLKIFMGAVVIGHQSLPE